MGENEFSVNEFIVLEMGYPGAIKQEVVGELVRCKDCKHYEWADNRAFGMPTKYCSWTGFEDVDDDDFCSRGERRTGNADVNT